MGDTCRRGERRLGGVASYRSLYIVSTVADRTKPCLHVCDSRSAGRWCQHRGALAAIKGELDETSSRIAAS